MKFTREDELLLVSFLNLDIGFRSYALSNIKGPIDCWLFITKVLIVFDHPSLPIPENVIANSTSHPSSRSSAVGNCRVPNLFFIFITFLQVKVNNIFFIKQKKKTASELYCNQGFIEGAEPQNLHNRSLHYGTVITLCHGCFLCDFLLTCGWLVDWSTLFKWSAGRAQ